MPTNAATCRAPSTCSIGPPTVTPPSAGTIPELDSTVEALLTAG